MTARRNSAPRRASLPIWLDVSHCEWARTVSNRRQLVWRARPCRLPCFAQCDGVRKFPAQRHDRGLMVRRYDAVKTGSREAASDAKWKPLRYAAL
jgi:hypothetical protein